ncbi:retrovirus-related pol polyprotein from transposon tnt 1-94 [Lasius niger]|uniref:Retrovirus-related pol polyprotein from transposon tnt 1-94 n=1 Tax=Lasius niger TaxID=67767 RepID=A0A0J7K5E4_LASNI|nr:retrovirus-related pol polyprotein from transposon tnt 1-94 [Lasius niger]
MGLTECTKEAIYLRKLLEQLGFPELANITVFNNNLGALKLAQNSIYHSRSKHIDMRHHFIREALSNGLLKIVCDHVSTNDMPADMLTKGLPRPKHSRCTDTSGLQNISRKQG